MEVDFKYLHLKFDTKVPDGATRLRAFAEHTFGRPIAKAVAALNGFRLFYTQGDKHLAVIEADVDALIDNAEQGTVTARMEYMLGDRKRDDPIDGWISVIVFVQYAD